MTNPSENEENWFREQERRKREDEALAEQHRADVAARDARKSMHWMKCPKCGADLRARRYENIELDECVECHGTWLDAGELKALAQEKAGGLFGFLTRKRGSTGPLPPLPPR
ncbi:MAG: zf-TFIIB domain-containing protein [Candidatus Sericytochromatia bacterium]|nr:zf-TFIIB domain-containing protein [Candidatus Sericytochromatia bacterium]